MKKPRKKRTLKKYGMGSGNAGVIKGYMPNPSEVFRQNQIDLNQAKAEASSNPFVVGLDILGDISTQAGMSMFSKGMADYEPQTKVQKATSDMKTKLDYDPSYNMPTNEAYAAMGTGTEGVKTKQIEAEDGEVIKSPDGEETAELEGASHEDGGIPIDVEKGTQIFSKRIKIGGKTPAQREKARALRLSKLEKLLEGDPTDKITKESYERVKAQNEYESESDLMVQEYAKELDRGVDQGIEKFAGGGTVGDEETSFGDEVLKFFGGFSPGDYLGLAGNAYQGISAMQSARNNAATDTPNKNLYEGFADDAIQTMDEGAGMVAGQQAQAKKNIEITRNRTKGRGRAMSRGINQTRALDLASDVNANRAMEDMYTSFSKIMMDNLYKKSGVQMQAGQIEAQGATQADIANRMDKDNNDTQRGIAQNTIGQALQHTGKDLNANKRNRILTELTQQLSKYGLTYEGGKIVKGK